MSDIIQQSFYGNGKLLLSSEYFVLDGALSLALPTKLGQSLFVEKNESDFISWKSFDDKNQKWFEADFSLEKLEPIRSSDSQIATRLSEILQTAQSLNTSSALSADRFLQNKKIKVKTNLDFPRDWGLGTSSTLIYMIAEWAGVDAFLLLEKTFGGSGYDIACAGAKSSILYQREDGIPSWKHCDFNPSFSKQVYFIYLGKKQNSREGIFHYKKIESRRETIELLTSLTKEMLLCNDFVSFEKIINEHEKIISNALNLSIAKELYFNGFWGSIKSLGAWGGDFILATSSRSEEETKEFFNKKGFDVFLRYEDLIL